MRRLLSLLAAVSAAWLPGAAVAQTGTPVPQSHIPSSVLLELRSLESQFDLALAQDCAAERCFSKGCVYRDHVVVDMPRQGSLPGLSQSAGPGSVPVQEYLTQARCEFTHEKSVPQKDVQALVRRLEQRLSKGWLRVTVGRQILLPISEELREAPQPVIPPAPAPVEAAPVAPIVPESFEAGVALRELWVSLLPHFSWMIALLLGTLATLLIIWALRRLGRESVEEKALAAQLAVEAPLGKKAEEAEQAAPTEAAAAATATADAADGSFVRDQQQLWTDRIAQAELARDESVVVELLREWLKSGEFELLAKAIFVFGDRLSLAFSTDGELAMRKVEFADYLRTLDEKQLPSDAEFFRKLNQHAISSSLLAQEDAGIYRSLREEFGSSGVARLIESLQPRHGALLFAFVPPDLQQEVSRTLPEDLRLLVASELLVSNRISREETGYVLSVLGAARAGRPLPDAPAQEGISDRGREFDAAGALSVLLPRIDPEARKELFAAALDRSSGTFPGWYENILYGDMLMKLPDEMRADLLLEVDLKGLAGWSSVQQPAWQETFINRLAPSMQNAVRASMSFGSRADQLRHARRGHQELVSAVKRQVARGKLSFAEIVA
jgi:hypothetical protein